MTLEEKNRTSDLDIEIAKLKTRDIPTQVTKIKNTIGYLENLTTLLSEVETKLSDEVISDICKLMEIYFERESAAQSISVDKFKSKYFTQTGSEIWYHFIAAARHWLMLNIHRISYIRRLKNIVHSCQQLLTTEDGS